MCVLLCCLCQVKYQFKFAERRNSALSELITAVGSYAGNFLFNPEIPLIDTVQEGSAPQN